MPESCNAATAVRDESCQQPPQQQNTTAESIAAAAAAPKTRRIEQDYDIRDLLGSGTVGQVRRAIHRQSGQERAVKIIRLQPKGLLLQRQNSGTAIIEAEASLLKKLSHAYIVKLYDVYICHNSIYLVMELLVGGDLFDRIVQKNIQNVFDILIIARLKQSRRIVLREQ